MARGSRLIDPDLAALRSVSAQAMIRMQWRRNEQRLEAEMYDYHLTNEERYEYCQRNGIGWL